MDVGGREEGRGGGSGRREDTREAGCSPLPRIHPNLDTWLINSSNDNVHIRNLVPPKHVQQRHDASWRVVAIEEDGPVIRDEELVVTNLSVWEIHGRLSVTPITRDGCYESETEQRRRRSVGEERSERR